MSTADLFYLCAALLALVLSPFIALLGMRVRIVGKIFALVLIAFFFLGIATALFVLLFFEVGTIFLNYYTIPKLLAVYKYPFASALLYISFIKICLPGLTGINNQALVSSKKWLKCSALALYSVFLLIFFSHIIMISYAIISNHFRPFMCSVYLGIDGMTFIMLSQEFAGMWHSLTSPRLVNG